MTDEKLTEIVRRLPITRAATRAKFELACLAFSRAVRQTSWWKALDHLIIQMGACLDRHR